MSPTRPIAVRVPPGELDVLEAAAFVREISLQKLVEPAVRELATMLGRDPAVAAAVAARKASRDVRNTGGTVSQIPAKKNQ
jgi:hypothetical protein